MNENDINILYSKANNLDKRVTAIETSTPFLKEMLERNVEGYEKLASTMQHIEVTMQSMNDKIDAQTESMRKQSESLSHVESDFFKANEVTNERIDKLNDKVVALEEKGKFDITLFLKKNWPWITVILGLGIYAVSNIVKF